MPAEVMNRTINVDSNKASIGPIAATGTLSQKHTKTVSETRRSRVRTINNNEHDRHAENSVTISSMRPSCFPYCFPSCFRALYSSCFPPICLLQHRRGRGTNRSICDQHRTTCQQKCAEMLVLQAATPQQPWVIGQPPIESLWGPEHGTCDLRSLLL